MRGAFDPPTQVTINVKIHITYGHSLDIKCIYLHVLVIVMPLHPQQNLLKFIQKEVILMYCHTCFVYLIMFYIRG